MVSSLEHLLSTLGYLALFIFTVAQCCGIPISSEVVLPFAGALTVTGTLDLPLVILVALIGELCGALLAYGIAAWVGREAIVHFGGRLHLKESHFQAAERFYARRGVAAVALGRVIPVIRSYTSFPAGFARMPLSQFIPATLVGALVWDTALTVAGMELGRHFSEVSKVIKPIEYVALVLVVVAMLYGLWRYINRPVDSASQE